MPTLRQADFLARLLRSHSINPLQKIRLAAMAAEEPSQAIDLALAEIHASTAHLAAERLVEQDGGPQEDYPTPADLPVQESPAMLRALRLAREHGIDEEG